MLPVRETPPLPYPTGSSNSELLAFNGDMVKSLYQYLSEVARRVNQSLPKDGTEPMTGSLNLGGFSITNVANITTSGTATFTTLHVTGTSALDGAVTAGASLAVATSTTTATLHATGTSALDGAVTAGSSVTAASLHVTTTSALDGQTTQAGLLNLTSGQIAFPATQVPSAGVNTLDDYEEGTWTPVVTAQTGTITTVGAVSGRYTKVGNLVRVNANITITTVGTATNGVVFTLPFTSAAGQEQLLYGREGAINGSMAYGIITSGGGSATCFMYNATSPFAIGNGLKLTISGEYNV